MPLGNKPFENTLGKGEIARNEQFLLFPQCFPTCLDNFLSFSSNLKLSSANSFSFEESKICRLVNGQVNILHAKEAEYPLIQLFVTQSGFSGFSEVIPCLMAYIIEIL